MTFRYKKILLITGVIAIVAFAGIFALRFYINTLTPQIEAALSTALGMDIRLKGEMGVSLFPGLGLSLKDVSVLNNGLDVATIEKMKVAVMLMPLARFEIEIVQVELYKPVISILRPAEGPLNFGQPLRVLWERLLAVKRISVFQGTLFMPMMHPARKSKPVALT